MVEPDVEDAAARLRERGLPYVALGRPVSPEEDTPYVDLRGRLVAELLLRHLREQGAVRPAGSDHPPREASGTQFRNGQEGRGPAARRSRLATASPSPSSAGRDATMRSHPRWSSSRRSPYSPRA